MILPPPQTKRDMLRYELGKMLAHPDSAFTGREQPFVLSEDMLNTGMTVIGRTGSGKSSFLSLFCRLMVVAGRGFCVIDPGDLCEDIMAFVCRKYVDSGDRSLLRRVHYLDPTNYKIAFGWDPFQFDPVEPIHPEFRENAYRAWLHCTAHKIAELVQLQQGGLTFEGMPRLQRVLTDLLIATGTAVDEHGTHLPLADALVLLDPDHPRHERVFQRVAPFLDRDVLGDFERLRSYRRVEDRMREAESTLNRLRALLSPITKAIFSVTGTNRVNVRRIIQNGEILLWHLRPNDYFGNDQKSVIGKLAIHEVIHAMIGTPREMRKQFTLIVDELAEFLTEEYHWALGALRKHRCSLVSAAQDLSSFRKHDVDYTAKVLDQPGVLVSFEQRWPDDLEILARLFFTGNMKFEKLMHEVERHGGYAWHRVRETSQTFNQQLTWGNARAISATASQTETNTLEESAQNNWTKTKQQQRSVADGRNWNDTKTHNAGRSGSESPLIESGNVTRLIPLAGSQSTDGVASARGGSEVVTSGESEAAGIGGSAGVSHSNARGTATGTGATDTTNTGTALGVGVTLADKQVPLAVILRELQETGQLRDAPNDQIEQFKAWLHRLRKRRAAVKLPDVPEGQFFEVHNVPPPFVSEAAQAKAVEWLKRQLLEIHPYFFVPSFAPEEQDRRLAEFGRSAPAPPVAPLAVRADAPPAAGPIRSGQKPNEDTPLL